jgi:hypothetical protein
MRPFARRVSVTGAGSGLSTSGASLTIRSGTGSLRPELSKAPVSSAFRNRAFGTAWKIHVPVDALRRNQPPSAYWFRDQRYSADPLGIRDCRVSRFPSPQRLPDPNECGALATPSRNTGPINSPMMRCSSAHSGSTARASLLAPLVKRETAITTPLTGRFHRFIRSPFGRSVVVLLGRRSKTSSSSGGCALCTRK